MSDTGDMSGMSGMSDVSGMSVVRRQTAGAANRSSAAALEASRSVVAGAIAGGALVVLLAVTGCGGTATGSGMTDSLDRPERPRNLQVALVRVTRQPVTVQREFTGTLLPARGTPIFSEVDGVAESFGDIGPLIEGEIAGQRYAVKLGIQPGQQVAAGDLLVQLDPTRFELEVAAAQGRLEKARADHAKLLAWERPESIARIQASLAEAAARHKLALAEHQRALTLSRQSAASRGEVERAAMELAVAEALLASQQATLDQAEAGPTAEEIAVSQALVAQAEAELAQARHRLQKTEIRAPYDGVLTEVNVFKGQQVSPATGPMFQILDVRYLAAEVGVPEAQIGKIKRQDHAAVRIAGSTEPVPGVVVAINEQVSAESRSFRIRVGIDNAERRFMAGQFATVQLDMGGDRSSLVVPTLAIKFAEGEPGVFVYRDGQVSRRNVTLGMAGQEHTEILSGVGEGELVVVDDPNLITDGMDVEVRNPDIMAATTPQRGDD